MWNAPGFVVVTVAACLLAATACGGSSTNVAQTFKPGDTTPTPSASATASSTVDASAGTRDTHIVFSTPMPADGTKHKIIAGWRKYVAAAQYSEDHRSNDGYLKYVDSEHVPEFIAAMANMRWYKDWGVMRYFATRVEAVYHDSGATVVSCEDFTKLNERDLKKKVTSVAGKPSKYNYAARVTALARQKDGTWKVGLDKQYALPNKRAKECQP